ncbi:MAG: response regulator [SAR324 cluster bacterium]|nr:response regulator [SAR324 cluster bacterium]MED5516598.1 response regulator [SAR324 cluster bacterium]
MTNKSSKNILIVDEYAFSRRVLVDTLKQLKYENIEEVPDVYSGLVRLKSGLFDLVITKWETNKMNGLEFLMQIRFDPNLKEIPVLMVFEDEIQENIVATFKAGLNSHVVKPVDLKSFAEKMEEIFK